MTPPEHALFPTPSLLDPRVMLMVPRDLRPAMTALWQLDARLLAVVVGRREDMLAQLKLAWWRDRLRQLADAPASLPRGEPLLHDLAIHWGGSDVLAMMVDGYEGAMLAETGEQAEAAAAALASVMQRALAVLGHAEEPRGWALVRAGQLVSNREIADHLWRVATDAPINRGDPRAVRTLARWARLLAGHQGAASPRAEWWLLFRAGLGF